MRGPFRRNWLGDDREWMKDAACLGKDPNLFFPTKDEDASCNQQVKEAKAVCEACSVRLACLDWALRNYERFGIWGGKTTKERQRIRRKRREGVA